MFSVAVLAWLLPGCAPTLSDHARRQAISELHCVPPGLRVRAVGELRSRGPSPQRVQVFDAEGCDAEQRYFCISDAARGPRCASSIDAIAPQASRAGLLRALALLRAAARGRCPGETLRVAQESDTLFRFEACDGAWDYHCRARGCVRMR